MPDKTKLFKPGDKFRLSAIGRERYPEDTHDLTLTVEFVCDHYGPITDPDPTSHPAFKHATGCLYEPTEEPQFPFALTEEEMDAV